MKKIVLFVLLSALMLASCGNQSSGTVNPSSEEPTVSESSEENSLAEQSTVSVYTEEVESEHLCSDEEEWDYVFKYDNIPEGVICYIGLDTFDAWVKDESYAKDKNIQNCIEYFGLTKEDLTESLDPPETDDTGFDLTVSEIDALCSGDQAKINRAFASQKAVVSENGSIYTISWLAAHTAEDYQAAELDKSAIETAIQNCMEPDNVPAVNEYIEKAKAAVAEMK